MNTTNKASCPFEQYRAQRAQQEAAQREATAKRVKLAHEIQTGTRRLIGLDAKGLPVLLGRSRS